MNDNEIASRVDVEFSLGWAEDHPKLMGEQFAGFFREHPTPEWRHSIKTSPGFVTLIAYREQQ